MLLPKRRANMHICQDCFRKGETEEEVKDFANIFDRCSKEVKYCDICGKEKECMESVYGKMA